VKGFRLGLSVVLVATAGGIVALTSPRRVTAARSATAQASQAVEQQMTEAANRFLARLTEEQRSEAMKPFLSDERFNWHYVPRVRTGVSFKELTEPQRESALALLRTGLSARGFQQAETIRSLEVILQQLEKGRGPIRDTELYYFTIFGTPSDRGLWGWRYEGHHLSFHWTIKDGKAIATTPQFMGSNPAEVRVDGKLKGTRPLGVEEDLGRKLLKSLNDSQRAACLVGKTPPVDILTTNERKASILAHQGVAFTELSRDQQQMLMAVISEIAETHVPELAKKRMARVAQGGLDTLKFAWMGGAERGQPHYYRIQGKSFLIELDNTQNDANHVHIVWRDFENDFGRDLLEEHYRSAPKNHGHDR
jgi:hypothetical protein